jgi:hypothetical protein
VKVEGELLSIMGQTIRDKQTNATKRAVKYRVLLPNGDTVCFIGPHQVNEMLRMDHVGHLVSIECVGEDTAVKRGENCMKVFRICVSRELVRSLQQTPIDDGPMITDADIPF